MPVNKNEIRKDVLAKAMQCKTADELMEHQRRSGSLFCGTFRH